MKVRSWDPAGEWQVGDTVIVARRIAAAEFFEARLGEIVADEEDKAAIRLDGINEPVVYRKAPAGSPEARRWRAKVEEVIAL